MLAPQNSNMAPVKKIAAQQHKIVGPEITWCPI